MPLYEYTCEKCHERSELLITGEQKPVCPKCGSERMHKEYSTFATSSEGSASSASGHSHSPGCGCCMPGGACGLN
ncbi:MAG: FmdB family zinc ribbon protein [Oceanipulchritudo sp.]